MVPNYLLYAANLHVGGAVQVAASVIDALSLTPAEAAHISLLVSSEVDANVRSLGVALERFRAYAVEDHRGLRALGRNLDRASAGAAAMLVLFGPLYQLRVRIPTIVGFAQPWIIYPNNEIARALPLAARLRVRIKYRLQALFFRRADMLVVELEHVQRGLARVGLAAGKPVQIVRNCLAALYSQPERWQPAPTLARDGSFRLGFVGRNYAHKNTRILPEVRQRLRRDHGVAVTMYVTFSAQEWDACPAQFRAEVVNVGTLNVAQCPAFYEQLDAVIFPSLLECFSAAPLEAMAMKRPLFASDRPFNRDICGAHAVYFDPLDAADAAARIAAFVARPEQAGAFVDAAYRHVMAMPDAAVRAQRYLDCLRLAHAA